MYRLRVKSGGYTKCRRVNAEARERTRERERERERGWKERVGERERARSEVRRALSTGADPAATAGERRWRTTTPCV